MPADLFVYALVAAGLVLWLRNILGTRHGDERERPDPFANVEKLHKNDATLSPSSQASGDEEDAQPADLLADLKAASNGAMTIDNKTAENALMDIAAADKGFDIKQFLTGAQDAFVMIVEAFAEGDRDTLKALLDGPVYDSFEAAITARDTAGETMQKEIHAVRKSSVVEASLQNKMAYVTVRFVADEMSVTRNKDEEVIDGNPDKVTEMIDIWTFGRSIKSKDPTWLVYATRSDDPDDNQTIPNAE